MRDTIEDLFKYYYGIKRIVKRIVIRKDRGGQMIMVSPSLFAVEAGLWKWGTTDIPDVDKADVIQEQERLRVANLLYDMAINALENQDKRKEFEFDYGKYNISKEAENDLINYALRAFYFLKILTPYEYDVSEPEFDEEGVLLGFKGLPKKRVTDEDIAPFLEGDDNKEMGE